ncbi:MAG: hypothetical protein AAGF11_28065 [Myxococcota bacterium]
MAAGPVSAPLSLAVEPSPEDPAKTSPSAGDSSAPSTGEIAAEPPAADAPVEGAEGTPAEGAEGAPAEGAEGAPTEGTEDAPAEGAEEAPAEGAEGAASAEEVEAAPVQPTAPVAPNMLTEEVEAAPFETRQSDDEDEPPPDPRAGIALIASGAAVAAVGLTLGIVGVAWGSRTRAEADALRLVEASDELIQDADRRSRIALGLTIGGAVLFAAGVPLLVVGILRNQRAKKASKRRAALPGRAWAPSLSLGPREATAGLRVRF